MGKHDDAERVEFATRQGWRDWLAENHATSTGVFVVYFKKSAGRSGPTYDDLIEEALCFGWVDSVARAVDEQRTSLWFCPRKKGSGWAATNKARIARLEAEGLIAPAGRAAIEQAKKDGSWSKLDRSEAIVTPPALARALRAYPGSKRNFDAFPPGVRKQLIFWVDDAKRAETRDQRADEIARLAQQNIRANQWRPKA